MNRIENEALGLDYEIPELTQGRVEDFYRERGRIEAGMRQITADSYVERLGKFAGTLAKLDLDGAELQAVLTEFTDGLTRISAGAGELSGAEGNGATVRAMARLDWLDGVDEDDVAEMKPAAVRLIAMELVGFVNEAYRIPGE